MLCPRLCLIEDRQFRIPNYPIKMLIISYLDKAFPIEGSCCTVAAHLPGSRRDHCCPCLWLVRLVLWGSGIPASFLRVRAATLYQPPGASSPQTGWSRKSLQALCADVEGVIIAPSATRIYATRSPSLHDPVQSSQDGSAQGAIPTHTSDRPEALEAFEPETLQTPSPIPLTPMPP